jgi:hypothetical protein
VVKPAGVIDDWSVEAQAEVVRAFESGEIKKAELLLDRLGLFSSEWTKQEKNKIQRELWP